eukprot:gene20733-biopygen23591
MAVTNDWLRSRPQQGCAVRPLVTQQAYMFTLQTLSFGGRIRSFGTSTHVGARACMWRLCVRARVPSARARVSTYVWVLYVCVRVCVLVLGPGGDAVPRCRYGPSAPAPPETRPTASDPE